ncbi:major capsid protein [Serratia odorifera]|uniref:major capsid protein n=1 Tax=Serratia odorifera TaxID=618 RepID=UPI0018E6E096|nr:major capsid protein [Serratia odorifera]MBJ2065665.1 major capsid protein [Serratia odorifera]
MSVLNPKNGYIYDLSDVYNVTNTENLILSSLDLFNVETHQRNRIAIDKMIAKSQQMLLENKQEVHSDFNTTERQFGSSYLYQMIYHSAIDSVTSRDVEKYLAKNSNDVAQTIDYVVVEFAVEQANAYRRTKEQLLRDALLGGVAKSKYAEQGDLNFYTEFGQSKTEVKIDAAETANIPEQLDTVWRTIRGVTSEQAGNLQGVTVLCSGKLASALKYHASITQAMMFMGFNSPDNFYTQYTEMLPGYSVWKFKNFTFVDVTGDKGIEDYIGADGAVFIPRFNESSGVYTLHTGVGVKSAYQGKELGEVHQYMVQDERFGYPSVVFESATLPINHLPQAIVFASVA